MKRELTPREIVEQLDRHIVGQQAAKRAVAIAIRNRVRRNQIPDELRDEVIPKNILMIGPTGVGKTEIARRLSTLVNAPFLKVEASKFTETGYVGRDVESIVRDLVEVGYRMVERQAFDAVEQEAEARAEERLLDILAPLPSQHHTGSMPWSGMLGGGADATETGAGDQQSTEASLARQENQRKQYEQAVRVRDFTRKRLEAGELEEHEIELEVEQSQVHNLQIFSAAGMEEMGLDMQDLLGNLFPRQKSTRRMTVEEAREVLIDQEAAKLIDSHAIARDAVDLVENNGIVFLDELDKIAGRESGHGPDVSREGVQRDILPIVEGSTVMTKYGPVSTNHVLFVAAGAFHVAKPSDLIPELQGRFPIRVELDSLGKEEFVRILTEPNNALVKQYTEMMATEDIALSFTEDAVEQIAEVATIVNERTENIGARRLYTIMETLLEDISFDAPDLEEKKIVIDARYVEEKLDNIVEDEDLSRYIL